MALPTGRKASPKEERERQMVPGGGGWANRTAHEELLVVLEDKGEVVSTVGGEVKPQPPHAAEETRRRARIDEKVVEDLPTGTARIEILHSDQLGTAQAAVKAIMGLSLVLSLLSLSIFALAIYLSRRSRRDRPALRIRTHGGGPGRSAPHCWPMSPGRWS